MTERISAGGAAMTQGVQGRVSVVIPCYNVASLVHRALDSVLAQTRPDVEVLVVDDCSPDNLHQALEPYQGRIVLCRHTANQGVSAARNTGAARASGEILAFLDADDWWPPDFLQTLAPQVEPGTVICYDNLVVPEHEIVPEREAVSGLVNEDGPTLFSQAGWTRPFLDWDSMDLIFHDAPIFKILLTRADFERAGGYDTRFHGIEDFHLCVKLLAHRMRLQMARAPRGYYLVHGSSFVRAHNRDLAKQMQSVGQWQTMTRAMPLELALNPASAAACRRGHQYWTMRRADLLIRQHAREKQWGQMLTQPFLRAVVPALPALCAAKARSLARRVQALRRAKPAR